MRKISYFVMAAVAAVFLASCQGGGAESGTSELVVYTYDSFASEWGLGPQVIPLFEEAYGCTVRLVPQGDGGQLLAALIREKGNPGADVAIGLDNNQIEVVKAEGVLEAYRPEELAELAPDLVFDPELELIPFDYGYFTLIQDTAALPLEDGPKHLEDLTDPRFAGKVILMDPRTSTPGLGFLAMVTAVYGDGWEAFWERLEPSILTTTAGWDAGYGLFTKGEAPLVWSYSSSPAYHAEYEASDRYRAVDLAEGMVRQIEGVGVVRGTDKADLSRKFVDFCLSPAFQDKVPLYQWMFPVRPEVILPASYSLAIKPTTVLSTGPGELDAVLKRWSAMAGE